MSMQLLFFREKGCDLTVMATAPVVGEYSVHFENAGYKVVHNPYPARRNYLSRLLYWASFTSFIKKEKFDVIHIHTSAIMWEIAFCSWLAGIRSVFTFHSVFTSHFYSYPLHLIQRWTAKKYLAVSSKVSVIQCMNMSWKNTITTR